MVFRDLCGVISAHCHDLEVIKAAPEINRWMDVLRTFEKCDVMDDEVDSDSYMTQIRLEREHLEMSSVGDLVARVGKSRNQKSEIEMEAA